MADHTAEYCGPRIFLAHAKEDTDQVRKVYRQLLSDGYEPWFDDECLLPGDNWQVETLNAIFNCDAFVAFFSHNALAGFRNVQEEFRVALETAEKRRSSREVRLIPTTLDNCKVPKVGTFGKHWDSFASVHLGGRDWRSGYARLIKSLGHLPEPMIPENRWEALERTVETLPRPPDWRPCATIRAHWTSRVLLPVTQIHLPGPTNTRRCHFFRLFTDLTG